MPTGAGKSLIYQIPALVLEGTSIVISPLIALMKDQVDALTLSGVSAVFINSSQNMSEQEAAFNMVADGNCKLLYVAPERLSDKRFVQLCQSLTIPLVAVDEAHCVSQWGNDFRKSYKDIPAFINQLPTRPVVCALTATATYEVREDITVSLKQQNPHVRVAGFDRSNLYLGVVRPDPSRKMDCLLDLVRKRAGAHQTGIVYCSTRQATEEVFAALTDEGFSTAKYHAGMSDVARKRNQDDFVYDRSQIMVATNAFGMGIDKSNISFLIHYNMPRDLESYYQEAGRAGRDGSAADCILIYNKKDQQTVKYFAEQGQIYRSNQGYEPELSAALYQRDLERVRKMTAYCTTSDCLRSFVLRYFGESDSPYRCENCSSCAATTETRDVTLEAQKIASCVYRLQQRGRTMGRVMVVDILRGSANQRVKQLRFDQLTTYGIMTDVSTNFALAIMDALIDAGHLQLSNERYPVVSITSQGVSFLQQRDSFSIKVATAKSQDVEKTSGVANRAKTAVAAVIAAGRTERYDNEDREAAEEGTAEVTTTGINTTGVATANIAAAEATASEAMAAATTAAIDQQLLAKLKALRTEIAREQQLPAFIVFHDSTLVDMCAKMPKTVEEFLTVSGVGAKKAELYAERFLAHLNKQ
jgi:ATP-dependent DNA helicase RecQ